MTPTAPGDQALEAPTLRTISWNLRGLCREGAWAELEAALPEEWDVLGLQETFDGYRPAPVWGRRERC